MNKYCKILGVAPDHPVEEVKKAYREKVKTLHPDINKAANAHEKFLELQEAFDWFLQQDKIRKERAERQQFKGAHKNYTNGSFDSFYYRQHAHKRKHTTSTTDRKVPVLLYWFFHALFFVIGIAIMINTIMSFIHFLVPHRLSSIEYIAMLVFTLVFGIVLTGVSVLSALYFRSPRNTL